MNGISELNQIIFYNVTDRWLSIQTLTQFSVTIIEQYEDGDIFRTGYVPAMSILFSFSS